MRCLICEGATLSHICQRCRREVLAPQPSTRQLSCGLNVYSFYRYDDIAPLLHTKHTDLGYYIFSILAALSFTPFAQAFDAPSVIGAVAVDDQVRSGYAHSAILTKALTCKQIIPLYGRLLATKPHHYAGKSLVFRKANPRGFTCKPFDVREVIVVDDIITTGTTLEEAVGVLRGAGKEVLFALTLADARL